MRLRHCLTLVLLLGVKVAFADPEPSRFIIVLPSLSFGSPSSGNIVIVPGTGGLVFPGFVITSRPVISTRPIITSRPTVVVPGGYFLVQFRSGNWTVVWYEPLKTNVVILGRPFVRPTPLFLSPYFFDPSVTFGVPQIWHSPFLQPGVLIFKLRHRSAEEVAKLLNEARVVPDGQFVGIGNTLIVSAPSLATSGVQQSRIRDIVSALDQPLEKTTRSPSSPSPTQWQVEVYSVHSTVCSDQMKLPSDRALLVKLSGYDCAHKLGETNWNPISREDVVVKGEKVDVRLQARKLSSGWQFTLKGQFNSKPIEFEGQAPDTSQPILIVAPTTDLKEGLVLVLVPRS